MLTSTFEEISYTAHGHTVMLRRGTNDGDIFAEIFSQNVYRLPSDLTGAVIVDLGAHCGFFSLACLARGAAQVYAFEPDPGNIALARAHLAPYGSRVQCYQLAVVRSDVEVPTQWLASYPWMAEAKLFNTGGLGTLATSGVAVETISFDALVRLILVSEDRDVISLLKIDVQGGEWPVLLTAQTLGSIQRLVGEFQEHGVPGGPAIPAAVGPGLPNPLTHDLLADCLRSRGFTVEIVMTPTDPTHTIGLLFAERRGPC